MILRKPYAFLIRFFQLIHIVLFIISGYMTYSLRENYIFFKDFVKNDIYIYIENIADHYISPFMFIVVIITLIMVIAIFYLMRNKEKPVFFYRIYIIYNIILLFVLIIYRNFYGTLEFDNYNRLSLSIYRDIIGFMYYAMYFFLIFDFIRGFGFDIKKFSFDKDLKDLNITDTDSEEFEFAISLDKDKIVEKIRRERRYAKYYFKENALTLAIIGFFLLAIGGIFLYSEFYKSNVIYRQNEIIVANDFAIKVDNAYLTNRDKYNQLINDNYLVVNFKVQNNGENERSLNITRMRVLINNKYYYPILNKYDLFNDLNSGYDNQKLKNNITNGYVLVFKIDDIDVKEAILELYDSQKDRGNEVIVNYKRLYLDLLETKTTKPINTNLKLSEEILFDNNFLKGSFTVINYEIKDRFYIDYEKCSYGTCNKYRNNIWSASKDVLKLELSNNNFPLKTLENYLSIQYLTDDIYVVSEYETKILHIDDNAIYIEVPKNIDDARAIILNINIHSYLYSIVLKGDEKNAS